VLDTGDEFGENDHHTGLTHGLDEKGSTMNSTDTAPNFADLGRDLLETADLEVVTSLVELPPSFQLPTHRHPGEEFAYVIDGAIYLWEHDTDRERHLATGSFCKVPLQAIHSVRTGDDEGATLIVFRVHTPGAPERELVDLDD
jgi:quercetin dioxygenase-like cupin family protein